jgi:hypothetical protein
MDFHLTRQLFILLKGLTRKQALPPPLHPKERLVQYVKSAPPLHDASESDGFDFPTILRNFLYTQ